MVAYALLHPVARIEWTASSVHWSTVVGLVALAALYLRAGRAARPAPLQRVSFLAALLVVFLSLNGPLHELGARYLFSAHMVQHLLLTLVMPPLLLLGIPRDMLEPALRAPAVHAVARTLTRAPIAFALFNVTLAAWHVPVLYNAAAASPALHAVQFLTLIATAVLMWWPLLSPVPSLPRLPYPGQMLYCFLSAVPMTIIAVYIVMADTLLYPGFASAPRLWGIDPMLDQHLGGLIMWVPGGLFFYAVMTLVFFRWMRGQQDDQAGAQVDWRPVNG